MVWLIKESQVSLRPKLRFLSMRCCTSIKKLFLSLSRFLFFLFLLSNSQSAHWFSQQKNPLIKSSSHQDSTGTSYHPVRYDCSADRCHFSADFAPNGDHHSIWRLAHVGRSDHYLLLWSLSKAGGPRRAKSVICGQGERHRNNILYKLKYGRGANCERSHYMKTAGRKCFATAENLQVQSDHQTVTLHLAWRLRSPDRYLPYRKGWIRCRTFVCCSLSHFFPLHVLFISPLTNLTSIFFSSFSHFFFPTSSSFPPQLPPLLSLPLPPVLSVFPLQQPYLIMFPSHVSPRSHLPFQTGSFLPPSPSFSLCLWSVTPNLAPSICFSSFV